MTAPPPAPARDPIRRADRNADWWWHDCAQRALEELAGRGQDFDAYSLTELGVPDVDDPHRWGALFRAAVHKDLITPVGYAPSRRPTAKGSVCRVWRGKPRAVDQAAA